MKKTGKRDWERIGMEILLSMIAAMGILAFVAVLTENHIRNWDVGMTVLLFLIFTVGIWRIFRILPLTSLD